MDNTRSSVTLDGPVVVGTDGSDHAMRAVRWAAQEATARNRPLRIVYATGTESRRPLMSGKAVQKVNANAEGVLEEAVEIARKVVPGITLSTALCAHDTTACLLGEAGPDATVVVGSRGRGGFAALLVGSDTLRVAARSRVPVVVVPRHHESEPAGAVLVAVRDERDRETMRLAARMAERRGATLRVLSAWIFLENVGSMATMFDDVSRIAEDEAADTARLIDPVRKEFPGLTVTEDVVRAASASAVLVAATAEADMVVIGSRRRSAHIGSPLGHVTHAVLHHSHCPILLVPHP